MQIRVVTLRYSEAQQGFPEEALRAATFGREVLAVGGVRCGGASGWRDGGGTGAARRDGDGGRGMLKGT